MREEQTKANVEKTKLGYSAINIVGWASKPFYDIQNRELHWAKELFVEGRDDNTLNYDVRVLGRNGVLSLGAIADIGQTEEVKENIPAILKMACLDYWRVGCRQNSCKGRFTSTTTKILEIDRHRNKRPVALPGNVSVVKSRKRNMPWNNLPEQSENSSSM